MNGGDASNIYLGWPWSDPDMPAINPGPYKERILASHGVSLEDLETQLIHKTLRLNALEADYSLELEIDSICCITLDFLDGYSARSVGG